ncbi:MAG: PhoH family protein [Flavobacteriaceae bacterium]|nr:PhoH family protein [Flavobacteriaceae bacterium]MCY4267513.1 PhoH family protein [Flavobacteriaceae bacterium]MCY4299699.1 PhoH family protein [Flavobacteriaceae bacterium]
MEENSATIQLKDINPLDFYGHQNAYINRISSFFPHLKLVARGNAIRVYGPDQKINLFKNKIELMFAYIQKHNSFGFDTIEQICNRNSNHADLKPYKKLETDVIVHGLGGKVISPKTSNQKKLVEKVLENDLVFVIGPAGTGKTYLSLALAVEALKTYRVKRIILTRPAVEAGEHLGFLPGDIKEKLDPYMQPLYDALQVMIPHVKLVQYIEKKIIQIAPIAFMRGRTLEEAFVILDEAQNTTQKQMKMFLTRMGKGSKFIVTGDLGQIDISKKADSGLLDAIDLFQNTKDIATVRFNEADVIRHHLVKKIIKAYQKSDSQKNGESSS